MHRTPREKNIVNRDMTKSGDLQLPPARRKIQCMVVSRYDRCFQVFAESYIDASDYPLIVMPGDGFSEGMKQRYSQFRYVDEPPRFGISAAFNIGISLAGSKDVVLMCDDIYIHTAKIMDKLQEVAYAEDDIGLVVPLIGNVITRVQKSMPLRRKTGFVNFMPYIKTRQKISIEVVYIKRSLINDIGLFDEGFRWHRCDVDYLHRAIVAGYQNAVCYATYIQHGGPAFGLCWGNSRRLTQEEVNPDLKHWIEKWGTKTMKRYITHAGLT